MTTTPNPNDDAVFISVANALDLIAPQFASVPTDTLYSFWLLIRYQVSVEYLSFSTPIMGANLLAHYYTLATDANYATAGTMSDQSLGQASVKFNVGNPSDNPMWADMCRTQYGITWYGMVQRTPIGAMVSNKSVFMGGAAIPLPPLPYGIVSPEGYFGY